MEQIEQIVSGVLAFLKESPLSLGIKTGLVIIIGLVFWWFKGQIKAALNKAAKEQRERDAVKDEQRIGEENERDNRELDEAQKNSDDWAAQEREKDKKP